MLSEQTDRKMILAIEFLIEKKGPKCGNRGLRYES